VRKQHRTNKGSGLTFILICVAIAVFCISPVFATVPVVNSVTAWTRQSDNHTILNITVTHYNYYAGHYVDWVQINVSGTIERINLTASSPVDQTANSTFIVPFDMGIVTDTPIVQAQAHCRIHGPSDWSTATRVPEFSSTQLLLASMVLAAAVSFSFRRRSSNKLPKTRQESTML
jgi:desulfoferrodoxin (superoxide reductase-like protein)